jgi:DNA polymerase I-like protein with 3'-5' exonuclease and polymerase domains
MTFTDEMKKVKETMEAWLHSVGVDLEEVDVNSPKQLHTWLYGGEKKYKVDVPVFDAEGNITYYKSGLRKGQPKFKKGTKVELVPGVLPPSVVMSLPDEAVNTSEETLEELNRNKDVPSNIRNTLYKILKYREYSKEYNTYFVGVGNYIWPDSRIHGNLNEAVTVTGRLASSNPNLQNLPSYSEE